MKKHILRMLMNTVLLIVLAIAMSSAASAATVAQGTFGIDNALTWTLDDAGTLTISGTGDMPDYGSSDKADPARGTTTRPALPQWSWATAWRPTVSRYPSPAPLWSCPTTLLR